MKLLFVINDSARACGESMYTGTSPLINRRIAEIELTSEQTEKIKLRKIGCVYESYESITPIEKDDC